MAFSMPEAAVSDIIRDTDILFGTYDAATDSFTLDPVSRRGVLVTASRQSGRRNPVATFLFRLAGIGGMDVSASAVGQTYTPRCLREGFTANDIIDVQSNNAYYKGFCMHSNSHVEMNSGNAFEAGTVVSMPDLGDFYENNQASTLQQNAGLEQALREDEYDIRILRLVRSGNASPLLDEIRTPGSDHRPAYITSTTENAIALSGNDTTLTQASFVPNLINTATCGGNQRITLKPASGSTAAFQNFVLVTNCEIQISGTVELQNVVLFTTSTSRTSVSVNSSGGGTVGLWLGRPDACGAGGGAQIITWGGFRNSAKLTMNGGQIIAMGDVDFAAQAEGVGASITANGRIDSTSNMAFTGCSTGNEQNFSAPYFRLAR